MHRVRLSLGCCLPIVALCLASAITAAADPAPPNGDVLAPLVAALGESDDPVWQRDVLRGMYLSLRGRRNLQTPAKWSQVATKLLTSREPEVREKTLALSVLFGDEKAFELLRSVLVDEQQGGHERRQALEALLQAKYAPLGKILLALLKDREVRAPALRGLAAYNESDTPNRVLRLYSTYSPDEKQAAIETLASRASYAKQLLAAIAEQRVPSADLSTFTARQITTLGDPDLTEQLGKVWGVLRPTSQDKKKLAEQLKGQLTPEMVKQANLHQGRRVFDKICANCHVLFDHGKKIGPDLTGAQRANLDYVLENLLDPSAIVGRDYQMSILETTDGRVITGIIQQEDDNTLTMQTPTDRVLLPKVEIESRSRSPLSLMPEGILDKLSPEEIRDLISYLASGQQISPEEPTSSGK